MPPRDLQLQSVQTTDVSKPERQQELDECLPVDTFDNTSDISDQVVALQEAPDQPDNGPREGTDKATSGITAGKAFLVFVGYVVGQIIGSVIVPFAAGALAGIQGINLNDSLEKAEFTRNMIAPSILGGMAGGILVMFLMALIMFRGHLRDGNPQGAAWRLGTVRQWLVGFFLGGIVSVASLFIITWVFPPDDVQQTGPLAQMAISPGLPRMIWFVFALLLAPIFEELLFRGIIFAGFCRRLGVLGGGIISTLLFVLLHVPEVMYYWPATLGITAIAITALVMRLRSAAVGPAIATHFGYNLAIALLGVISFSQSLP